MGLKLFRGCCIHVVLQMQHGVMLDSIVQTACIRYYILGLFSLEQGIKSRVQDWKQLTSLNYIFVFILAVLSGPKIKIKGINKGLKMPCLRPHDF